MNQKKKTNEDKPMVIKTIITQEMLKKGFLASNLIYLSHAHTEEIIDQYIMSLSEIFEVIAQAIKNNSLENLLSGPTCHQGFSRLT